MQLWLYTLGSVIGVSLISLLGIVALARGEEKLRRATTYLISLAVGGLLGGAALHLIPRSLRHFEDGTTVWLLLLAGFVGSFVLEKYLWAHHHGHDPTQTVHDLSSHRAPQAGGLPPLASMILLGDLVHNLLDGILIAAAFLVDPAVGAVTTLAVVLHEIPQEIGDFGVLVHAGLSTRKALLLNFLTATAAVLGAVLTLLIGARTEAFTNAVLPIAAGNFLYIAAADLVPELHERRGRWVSVAQVGLIVFGIGAMLGVRLAREALGGSAEGHAAANGELPAANILSKAAPHPLTFHGWTGGVPPPDR